MSEQAEQSDCAIIHVGGVKTFLESQNRPSNVKVQFAEDYYLAVAEFEGGVRTGVAFAAEGSAANEIVRWIIAFQMRKACYLPSLSGPSWVEFKYHENADPARLFLVGSSLPLGEPGAQIGTHQDPSGSDK